MKVPIVVVDIGTELLPPSPFSSVPASTAIDAAATKPEPSQVATDLDLCSKPEPSRVPVPDLVFDRCIHPWHWNLESTNHQINARSFLLAGRGSRTTTAASVGQGGPPPAPRERLTFGHSSATSTLALLSFPIHKCQQ
ncbi:hypothetical protein U1Q18_006415 [Sarracenia purpurea var. burkii]